MVKRTIDALQADPATAPVGAYATLIVLLALVHGSARLGSRFAITGASQKIEADPERPQFVLTETGIGYRLRAPD